jgi:hypothetical protein
MWVPRHASVQAKSFGIFECGLCYKDWVSAHAWRDTEGQACTNPRCKKTYTPVIWMWENFDEPDRRRPEIPEAEKEKPHIRSLCAKCRDAPGGDCTNLREDSDIDDQYYMLEYHHDDREY